MKYIVYKATGGLFHNLGGLSTAINLSISNDVTLIIDMDTHPAFGANFSDYFTIDCNKLKYRCNYDNISLPSDLKDIQSKRAGHFGYNGHNCQWGIDCSKEFNVVYGSGPPSIYSKIRVNDVYFKNIQSNNQIIGEKYISVHFRNSDRKNDTGLFFKKITASLKKHGDITTLYVASDDYDFYNAVETKFPTITIIRKTVFEKNLKNLHYGSKDKTKQMYDCLVDIYYILLSDVFIPSNNSGMSKSMMSMIRNRWSIFPNRISKTTIEM